MTSDAYGQGQGQQRLRRAGDGAESLHGAEPAVVTTEIGRGHAIELAQPALQLAVVSIDAVDVPVADRALSAAGVGGVVPHADVACSG